MRFLRASTWIVLAFLFLLPARATGAPILDQLNTGLPGSFLNGGSDVYAWQQGITAGLTGQLTQIDLFVDDSGYWGPPAPTELSVYLGAPWQSGPAAWTTITIPNLGWNTWDLTAATLFVASGDQFAVGIHGQADFVFPPAFGFTYGDQYLGGQLFLNGSSSATVGYDMLFRTHVNQVPEPASLVLLGTGLAGLARWRRRRT